MCISTSMPMAAKRCLISGQSSPASHLTLSMFGGCLKFPVQKPICQPQRAPTYPITSPHLLPHAQGDGVRSPIVMKCCRSAYPGISASGAALHRNEERATLDGVKP